MNDRVESTALPQPETLAYAMNVTTLFDSFTRGTILTLLGFQAEPFRPEVAIKRWADKDAAELDPDGLYTFHYFVHKQSVGEIYTPMTITNREAARFNLPGAYDFPKRVVKPSGVWSSVIGDDGQPLNKSYVPATELSERSEALQLIAKIRADIPTATVGPTPIEAGAPGGIIGLSFDPGETRRIWNISVNGQVVSAGRMITYMQENGIGSPGKFVIQDGQLMWASQLVPPSGAWNILPEVEVPCRDLYPNEKIVLTMFGNHIERTDLGSPATGTGAGSDPTGSVASNVAETLKRVKQIQRDLTNLKQPLS